MKTGNSEACPRTCNTGAQNTCREGLRACVDWVQVTFKKIKTDELISDLLLLDLDDFSSMEKGMLGYKRGMISGDIKILYDGLPNMGTHLIMSGDGCRQYEARIGGLLWKELFSVMLECEGSFTRLDIALDDFHGYFKIRQLIRKIKRGELQSKFKKCKRLEDILIQDGKTVGDTLYFGSESSRIRFRIYDKRLERIQKNEEVPEETWNRIEIQARDERAQKVAELIANGEPIGRTTKGILKHYLRFTDRNKSDRNKSRWRTSGFWERLLSDVEPLKLTEAKKERTVEKVEQWLGRQVAPSLAVLIRAYDGDMKKIYQLIHDGSERLKPKDEMMIARFKQKEALEAVAANQGR